MQESVVFSLPTQKGGHHYGDGESGIVDVKF